MLIACKTAERNQLNQKIILEAESFQSNLLLVSSVHSLIFETMGVKVNALQGDHS